MGGQSGTATTTCANGAGGLPWPKEQASLARCDIAAMRSLARGRSNGPPPRPDDSMLTGSPCHGRRHLESIQRGSLEADWRPHARGSSLPAGSTRRPGLPLPKSATNARVPRSENLAQTSSGARPVPMELARDAPQRFPTARKSRKASSSVPSSPGVHRSSPPVSRDVETLSLKLLQARNSVGAAERMCEQMASELTAYGQGLSTPTYSMYSSGSLGNAGTCRSLEEFAPRQTEYFNIDTPLKSNGSQLFDDSGLWHSSAH